MVDRLEAKSYASASHWPIVLLRVYAGLFFAWHGIGKISRGNFSDGMQNFLNSQLDNSFDFYRPFVEMVVLPNSVLFGNLVAWGELLIGLGLIFGLATRYAAFAGALLVANFWFAKGAGILDGTNHDVVWLMILVVLGTIPAGKFAGLDDGLSDRFRFLR